MLTSLVASCTTAPSASLVSSALPDERLSLAAPPATPASQANDDRIFAATRALKDTPRWKLAQSDADLRPAPLLRGFSCAAGFMIALDKAPHLEQILTLMANAETGRTSEEKHYWKRLRPFIGNDQPICVSRESNLRKSPSYPSGHTIAGYSTALVLSALLPERSAELLQRGRVIGESRIVCGVHWASDVAAGYQAAGAFAVATLENPTIRALMPQAREELLALQAAGLRPDAERCALEADAAAHSPFSED
ncbi:acid phosphatase precursor [Asaia krungthepensis NRIC 0535]|uniref:Acid phosphatase n=2 Tax=Asaia krungthepensis TaxID=220990 RepID=A0ABQ0Q6N3_9PROT|nr:acid phosphatase precursor [Asaia krungthepensis NRIC 0535]